MKKKKNQGGTWSITRDFSNHAHNSVVKKSSRTVTLTLFLHFCTNFFEFSQKIEAKSILAQ